MPDLHAVGATYTTMQITGGTSVEVAQEMARHGDPMLTMDVYT